MPQYDFVAIDKENNSCDYCSSPFEISQSLNEEPLAKCPKCGAPVKKAFLNCNLSSKKSTKTVLSDKNLTKHGFTKLVNEGGGKFRKTT